MYKGLVQLRPFSKTYNGRPVAFGSVKSFWRNARLNNLVPEIKLDILTQESPLLPNG